MKIALMHYHLKTGGVTTVVRQQAEALKNDADLLVMTGAEPDTNTSFDTIVIPSIGYDREGVTDQYPLKTADAIFDALLLKWPDGCDVLHVHNPLLSKNRSLLTVLKILQEKGVRLFLQIHDFAEDGRPQFYYKEDYPSDCHYGVINSRDYDILKKAGLKKEGLHQIENTIHFHDPEPVDQKYIRHILYPVRGIRRKNIGETILLSLFFKSGLPVVITLPPNHEKDLKSYEGWKAYVQANGLNVRFGLGQTHSFEALIRSSAFIITTSINEGFGFSFIELWTAGKLIWGRMIPDICRDFKEKGVALDHFYENLFVPVSWIGKSSLHEKMKNAWGRSLMYFNRIYDPMEFDVSFRQITQNGLIDFGMLDEAFQKQILSRVISDSTAKTQLIALNPFLLSPGNVPSYDTLIEKNRNAVKQFFTRDRYRRTLLDIYEKVMRTPVSHGIDKETLLSGFLNLDNMHLLKWYEDIS
ncbi:MAG: hypothetical protein KJ737_14235 [Proteobacteria bacterium]|nr:hypothetical protein [Pseudomonadota bacterium]